MDWKIAVAVWLATVLTAHFVAKHHKDPVDRITDLERIEQGKRYGQGFAVFLAYSWLYLAAPLYLIFHGMETFVHAVRKRLRARRITSRRMHSRRMLVSQHAAARNATAGEVPGGLPQALVTEPSPLPHNPEKDGLSEHAGGKKRKRGKKRKHGKVGDK